MPLETGDTAPDFELPNANASVGPSTLSFSDAKMENGTLVLFECNHCPYVVASVGRINANDPVVYENDSFEHMVKRAEGGMPYAYLHDASQTVARAYDAKRTPEFFLFDANDRLVYQGRMDDSPRNPTEVTSTELADAIEAMLNGVVPTVQYTESIGCSVKWKA